MGNIFESVEPESMELLADELSDKVEKLSKFSITDVFETFIPIVVDYMLRIVLVAVIFLSGES